MTKKKYSIEEVVEFVNGAIGERAAVYYYLYKVLKEKSLDARPIMEEIVNRYGESSLDNIEEVTGKINNYQDFMKIYTKYYDDATNSVFGIEIIKSDENESIVQHKSCPLVAKWREMGISKEEIKELCDIANVVDFCTVEHFGCVNLKFNKLIGHGDECCELVYSKK